MSFKRIWLFGLALLNLGGLGLFWFSTLTAVFTDFPLTIEPKEMVIMTLSLITCWVCFSVALDKSKWQ